MKTSLDPLLGPSSSPLYLRALRIGLWSFGILALLHLLAFLSLPYLPELGAYLWGGKVDDSVQLIVLEVVSIGVVLIGWGGFWVLYRVQNRGLRRLAGFVLAGYSLLFVLNTFGNLAAATALERSFSLLTAALSALCGWVAVSELRRSTPIS
ncbi:hypothetical protein GC167_06425 [bacterium]|nr:hypothetical protein [bacterium]